MGYWDGITANIFRHDTQGRRYYNPFGKWGRIYEVPDELAGRLKRHWQRFHQVTWPLTVALGFLTIWMPWSWKVWLLVWVPYLIGIQLAGIAFAHWTVRPLSEATIARTDLLPVSRREAFIRYTRAVGPRKLQRSLAVSVAGTGLVAALALLMAMTTGRIALWLVVGLFGALTALEVALWRKADGVEG
jgi:hypothetical protein